MALVHHKQIKEIGWVVSKLRLGVALLVHSSHEGLEDGEEDAAVLGNPTPVADHLWVNAHQCILRKGAKGIKSLIRKDVAIGKKEDAGSALGFLSFSKSCSPVCEVPAAVEELPCNLEGNRGLAGACGQREQQPIAALGNGIKRIGDGIVLVEAGLPLSSAFLKGNFREAAAPVGFLCLRFSEGRVPKLVRAGVAIHFPLGSGIQVHLIDSQPIGGVGEADLEFFCVAFGLGKPFGDRSTAALGLNDCKFLVVEFQHVVCDVLLGAGVSGLQTPQRDHFPPHPASGHLPPACGSDRRVNQFRSGFCFIEFRVHFARLVWSTAAGHG